MNLQLEVLDAVEAPMSNSEAIAWGIVAFETGLLIGLVVT